MRVNVLPNPRRSSFALTFTNCEGDSQQLKAAHKTGEGTKLIVSLTATRRCASACILILYSDITISNLPIRNQNSLFAIILLLLAESTESSRGLAFGNRCMAFTLTHRRRTRSTASRRRPPPVNLHTLNLYSESVMRLRTVS
jgi:hypothetical protein